MRMDRRTAGQSWAGMRRDISVGSNGAALRQVSAVVPHLAWQGDAADLVRAWQGVHQHCLQPKEDRAEAHGTRVVVLIGQGRRTAGCQPCQGHQHAVR